MAKKEEKTTALAPVAQPPKSVLAALAERMNCEPSKLMPMLKQTAFKACRTDEEFMSMCIVANTYGLNPILKEIHAFLSKSGAVIPVVGIDGWNHIMNAHPAFDGIEYEEGKDFCTAIIYRKDRSHPVKVTEWLSECMGNTEPWKKWPRRMLRHKATIQAARLAFGLGGIYDEDEARRIEEAHAAPPALTAENKATLRAALGITPPAEAAPVEAAPAPVTVEAEIVEANAAPLDASPLAADVEAVL